MSGGQRLELSFLGQPAERAALELADALGREADQLGHLAEGERLAAADAEAQLDHAACIGIEALESPPDRLLLELDGHLLERRRALEGDQRAELGIALRADRRLQAHRDALSRSQLLQLVDVH